MTSGVTQFLRERSPVTHNLTTAALRITGGPRSIRISGIPPQDLPLIAGDLLLIKGREAATAYKITATNGHVVTAKLVPQASPPASPATPSSQE